MIIPLFEVAIPALSCPRCCNANSEKKARREAEEKAKQAEEELNQAQESATQAGEERAKLEVEEAERQVEESAKEAKEAAKKAEEEGKKPRSSGAVRLALGPKGLDLDSCVEEAAIRTISHIIYLSIETGKSRVCFTPSAFLDLIGSFSSIFNARSIDISKDGKLIFGSVSGLTAVDPTSVITNTDPPTLAVSSINAIDYDGKRYTINFSGNKFSVDHNIQSININFVGLTYNKTEKNQYGTYPMRICKTGRAQYQWGKDYPWLGKRRT